MTEYAAVQSLAGKGKMILADALPTEPRAEILMSAAGCILADRNQSYGMPEDNFANITSLWNAYLEMRKQRLTPEGNQVGAQALDGADQAIMMALMKIARIATNPAHKDSWIDAVGYLACGWRCVAADMGLPLAATLADLAQGVSPAPVPFLDTLRSVAPAWAEGLEEDDEEEPFDYCGISGATAPEGIAQERWVSHLGDLEFFSKYGDDVQRRDWWTTPWGEWTENKGKASYPQACRILRKEAHDKAHQG